MLCHGNCDLQNHNHHNHHKITIVTYLHVRRAIKYQKLKYCTFNIPLTRANVSKLTCAMHIALQHTHILMLYFGCCICVGLARTVYIHRI